MAPGIATWHDQETILQIRRLSKTFRTGRLEVHAVRDVSLDVAAGECMAIVGESGSGKSTIANMVLGILQPSSGSMHFDGNPLPERRTLIHRRRIQLVQQNPLSSLNPNRTVGASLRLALDVHAIDHRSRRDLPRGPIAGGGRAQSGDGQPIPCSTLGWPEAKGGDREGKGLQIRPHRA